MDLEKRIKKVLKEDFYKKVEKIMNAIGQYLNAFYPNFNEANVKVDVFDDDVNHIERFTDPETEYFFARYDDRLRELMLNHEIHETLENFFNEEDMTYVIEWFNNEFGTNAEYLSY